MVLVPTNSRRCNVIKEFVHAPVVVVLVPMDSRGCIVIKKLVHWLYPTGLGAVWVKVWRPMAWPPLYLFVDVVRFPACSAKPSSTINVPALRVLLEHFAMSQVQFRHPKLEPNRLNQEQNLMLCLSIGKSIISRIFKLASMRFEQTVHQFGILEP